MIPSSLAVGCGPPEDIFIGINLVLYSGPSSIISYSTDGGTGINIASPNDGM